MTSADCELDMEEVDNQLPVHIKAVFKPDNVTRDNVPVQGSVSNSGEVALRRELVSNVYDPDWSMNGYIYVDQHQSLSYRGNVTSLTNNMEFDLRPQTLDIDIIESVDNSGQEADDEGSQAAPPTGSANITIVLVVLFFLSVIGASIFGWTQLG